MEGENGGLATICALLFPNTSKVQSNDQEHDSTKLKSTNSTFTFHRNPGPTQLQTAEVHGRGLELIQVAAL